MATAKERYAALTTKRLHYLQRARDASALTIPSLIPPEGHNETSKLYEPYQDLGAELVNFAASKMTTALYPPGQPSFRLSMTPRSLLQSGTMSSPPDVERGLTLTEKLMRAEIEAKGWRSQTNLSLQHLLVAGNVGELMLPSNKIKVYRLDQYCVVRDPAGEMIEFVIEEKFSPNNLPEGVRLMAGESVSNALVEIYTWGKKQGKIWRIHQEVKDITIPGSDGNYTINPFNALRWNTVAGEDYGRGKIEDHLPSLRRLEVLEQGMVEGTALATRHIGMVRPGSAGGLRLRRRLAKAENGEFIMGDPDHVGAFQFLNVPGLEIAERQIALIEDRLRGAFLMKTSVQRDAERVTAYELQLMTEELEGALGGVYSLLASDLQAFRVKRLMYQMIGQKALPELPEDTVEPTILTGLEALGRQGDVGKVIQGVQLLQPIGEIAYDYVKLEGMLKKAFNGLDLAENVRTEAEAQEFRQQRAAMAAAQAGGEALLQGAAQQATQGV